MIAKTPGEKIIFNISRFLSFFLVICGIVTMTMFLFLRGMELDEALIRENALYTFFNIIFLTVAGCVLDEIRRYQTIELPLKRIVDALDKIGQGDFSVRLDENHRDISRAGFQQISRGINHLAEELSGVETLRNDFVASVSHELKTPLAAVKNYATLLQSPNLTPEKRLEYTQAISQTTGRLADLVSNILRLNKLENQRIYPESRVFDLGEQLCESMLEFENILDEKHLELDVDLEENVQVEADPELLKLVWANLFSNAIKFTPAGGRIGLKLVSDENWVSVSVSDTGCGMTKETGAHIFEKFYQGDTAHATKGNGLGLALVKRVVDITGGAISVSSTPGKGSTFTVRLGRAANGAD